MVVVMLNAKKLMGRDGKIPTPSDPATIVEFETPIFQYGKAVVGSIEYSEVFRVTAFLHTGFKFVKADDWWRFRIAFLGFGFGLYRQYKKTSWS